MDELLLVIWSPFGEASSRLAFSRYCLNELWVGTSLHFLTNQCITQQPPSKQCLKCTEAGIKNKKSYWASPHGLNLSVLVSLLFWNVGFRCLGQIRCPLPKPNVKRTVGMQKYSIGIKGK